MPTNVSFQYPAELVLLPDDGILAVAGATWFVALLRAIPGLDIEGELCQEDWGVVIFTRRAGMRFWVGLSPWNEDGAWLAHLHIASLHKRFTSAGKAELEKLASGLHAALESAGDVSSIVWYHEEEMTRAEPRSFSTPHED